MEFWTCNVFIHVLCKLNIKSVFRSLWNYFFLQSFAQQLAEEGKRKGYKVEVINLKTFEPEDNLAEIVNITFLYSKIRIDLCHV